MINNTVAVVVTYNRRKLLIQCIQHLLEQYKICCDILIIDNASTDGTEESVCAFLDPRVIYKNTGSNLGGAGGFHFGIKVAVEAGYQYIWIMDDDTLPNPNALEKLFEAEEKLSGKYGWLSSRTLWIDGKDCIMNMQRKNPYQKIDNFDVALVPSAMASFVSLFFKAEIVYQFGLPIKEFFIWTDDWEYTRRISQHINCYTVTDSRVVHAMKSPSSVNIATDSYDRMSRYPFFYRNDVYLYRREGFRGWCWLLAKYIWHSIQVVLKSDNKLKKIKIIWKGFFNGIYFDPQIEFPLKIK